MIHTSCATSMVKSLLSFSVFSLSTKLHKKKLVQLNDWLFVTCDSLENIIIIKQVRNQTILYKRNTKNYCYQYYATLKPGKPHHLSTTTLRYIAKVITYLFTSVILNNTPAAKSG